MDRRAFRELIERLHEESQQQPQRHRRRVMRMILLGHVVLLAATAVVAAIFVGLIVLAFVSWPFAIVAFFIGVLLWQMLASVLVRLPPPEGRRIERPEAPRLFAMLDEVQAALGDVRLDRVYVNADLQAAAAQRPRLGLLGWHQNELVLGLPVLLSLSEDQIKAVTAHELAHLRAAHGRTLLLAYRARAMWAAIEERLDGAGVTGALLLRFASWYAPRLYAYTTSMVRAHEFEADWAAAEVAGADALATGLLAMEVINDHLDKVHSPAVWQLAAGRAEPPDDLCERLVAERRRGVDYERAHDVLERRLQAVTGVEDVHPCLADRLRVIGWGVPARQELRVGAWLVDVHRSAAQQMLGPLLDELIPALSRDLAEQLRPNWQEHRRSLLAARDTLADDEANEHARASADLSPWILPPDGVEVLSEGDTAEGTAAVAMLEALPIAATDLSLKRQWKQAEAKLKLEGEQAGRPLLEAIVQQEPMFCPANLVLGQILAHEGDERAVTHLNHAMEAVESCRPHAAWALSDFYQDAGDLAASERWAEAATEYEQELNRGVVERFGLTPRSRLKAHALDPHEVEAIPHRLTDLPEVKRAYLLQLEPEHLPNTPHHVLVVHRRDTMWFPVRRAEKLATRILSTCIRPDLSVVVIYRSARRWRRRLKRVPHALIYRKRRWPTARRLPATPARAEATDNNHAF